jgi:low molecular weight protein-tyrosine phosphatase
VTGWTTDRVRRAVGRRVQGAPGLLDRLGPRPPRPTAVEQEVAVLLVCSGNICRSPMAEGMLRRKLARAGLLGRVAVDSAGMNVSPPGRGPDWRARACMRRHGDSIRDLRTRRFSLEDFGRFDLILAMDEHNRRDLMSLARSDGDRARVRLLGDGAEVTDPVDLGPQEFERAYQAIDRATDILVDRLTDQLGCR